MKAWIAGSRCWAPVQPAPAATPSVAAPDAPAATWPSAPRSSRTQPVLHALFSTVDTLTVPMTLFLPALSAPPARMRALVPGLGAMPARPLCRAAVGGYVSLPEPGFDYAS